MQTQTYFDGIQTIHKIKPINQLTLLQLVQSIFEDITIYNDPQIRQLISNDPQGFVPIYSLLELPITIQFGLENIEILISVEQVRRVLTKSRKLVCVDFRVRRIQPFVDKIATGELVPVYVERLPSQKTADEIYSYFRNTVGMVYRFFFKRSERWAILILDNYQYIQSIEDSLFFQNTKIVIRSPENSLTIYQQCERLDSQHKIRGMYGNKKFWQEEQIDEETLQRRAIVGQDRNHRDRQQQIDGQYDGRYENMQHGQEMIMQRMMKQRMGDIHGGFGGRQVHEMRGVMQMRQIRQGRQVRQIHKQRYFDKETRYRNQQLKRIRQKHQLIIDLPYYDNSSLLLLRQNQ